MAADSVLGLYFEIAADPSNAQRAISDFESTTTASLAKVGDSSIVAGKSFDTQLTPALERTTGQTQQAHAAAMVLEQQMGIHLPRSITSMIAHSGLIGPALTAAFAPAAIVLFAENIPKVIHGIEDASLAIGGFGAASKKAFEESIKANDKALVSFQGLTNEAKIATGQFLILQTNQHLAALEAEKNNAVFSSNFTRYLAMAGAMGAVGLAQAYHGRAQAAINDDIAKQQTLLVQQLKSMASLEDERSDKTEKAAKQTKVWTTDLSALGAIYRELRGTLDPITQAEERYLQILQRIATATGPSYNAALLEKMALEQRDSAVLKAFLTDQENIDKAITKQIPGFQALAIAQTLGGNARLMLNAAQRAALPLEISGTNSLAMAIQRTREMTAELISGQLPAMKRLELQMQRQDDLAWKSVLQARQELAEHKITRAEEEAIEQQYTDFMIAQGDRLQAARAAQVSAYLDGANQELLAAGFTVSAFQAIYSALLKDLGQYLSHKATIKAGEQFAEALTSLAEWDFAGAAKHFAAMAAWGGLGATISGVAGTLANLGSGGRNNAVTAASPGGAVAAGASTGPAPALAPGAASAAARAQQQSGSGGATTIIVHVHGDLLDTPHTADRLAAILTDAVQRRSVNLVSRRALMPIYAAR